MFSYEHERIDGYEVGWEGFPAFRRWFDGAVGRMSAGGGPIVQTAVAAGLAWYVAVLVLGHGTP